MRKYLFFAGLLAFAATFTACSSDDEAVTPEQKLEGNAFMGVRLVTPSSTRADYEKYDATEDGVSAVKFFFYDKDGKFVIAGNQVNSLDVDETSLNDGANPVSVNYAAVIALQTNSEMPDITQVLAVANDGNAAEFNGLDLDKAVALANTAALNTNSFIMTGSVYDGNDANGGTGKYGTYGCTGKLCESQEEAKTNAVDIYIERLAAKVSVTNSTTDNTEVDASVYSDGSISDGKVKVSVLGWALNCLEPATYYLKHITSGASYFDNWNLATSYRSFWAEDAHYSGVAYDTTGFLNEDNNFGTCGLEYVTEASVGTNKPAKIYCKENTYSEAGTSFGDYLRASTSLLVVAQAGDGNTNYVSFGGTLYSDADYLAAVVNATGLGQYYVKTTENGADKYSSLVEEKCGNLKVVGSESTDETLSAKLLDGKVIAQITSTATELYTKTGDDTYAIATGVTPTTLNTALETTSLGYGFKSGLMYYSIPIKHLVNRSDSEAKTAATPKALGEYGVVRNHSYSITLESISGLGHAIWNPDEHIVPVDESTHYYLGAKLNVQAWRIVPTQGVDLGK